MSNYTFNLQGNQSQWAYAYLMDTDLEQMEFDKNFKNENESYLSIIDEEPIYHSLMNYPEEEEDQLYAEDDSEEDDDDVEVDSNNTDEEEDDRDGYRNRNQDNMYYLI